MDLQLWRLESNERNLIQFRNEPLKHKFSSCSTLAEHDDPQQPQNWVSNGGDIAEKYGGDQSISNLWWDR